MLWNGAPSLIASLNRDSSFGQVIEFLPDDDRTVKVDCTGMPPAKGPFVKLGTCEEDSKEHDGKDPSGRKILLKMWWDEEKQELRSKGLNVRDKVWITQVRKLTDEGILLLTLTNTREDGSECSFYCKFKKTKE
jgi:hypothetical protein